MQTFQIDHAVLVGLDFTRWTGTARLDVSEIPEATSAMPPKSIYSGGAVKVFDTALLNPFRNFRTQAEGCARNFGFLLKRFNGWLVNQKNVSRLEAKLDEVKQAFDVALDEFVRDYPANARAWADSCGKWSALVASRQPADIRSRFGFNWYTVYITPQTSGAAGNATDAIVKDIPDEALRSMMESLTELYEQSFNKEGAPSAKAYNALGKLAYRAKMLGFANPLLARLYPVLANIADLKNDTLTKTVLSRMDDPQKMRDILSIPSDKLAETIVPVPQKDDLLEKAQQTLNSMDVLDSLGLF